MAFAKPQRPVERIFLHCSASDHPDHDSVAVMRDWHVNGNGWSDVGYHYFIRKDGTIEHGRDLETTPAAQKGHNSGTIAICLHGLTAAKFTKAQYASVIALSREIDAAYQGMVSFHGHNEVSSKACPVFAYRLVLGLDDHGSMDFAPTASPGAPGGAAAGPATGPNPVRPTLRLMDKGPAVLELQNRLSAQGFELEEDGAFGQITLAAVKQFQTKQGLQADGIVGPKTWDALLG